jgi:hypothetical protein
MLYRQKITQLEEIRCQLQFVREQGRSLFQTIEQESSQLIHDLFYHYGTNLHASSVRLVSASEKFERTIHSLPSFQFDPANFEVQWKPVEPVFFEDFSTGLDMKDLLFGVPLHYSIRLSTHIVPPFLKCSFEEIERRGLEMEGIYRIAGKVADRNYWKNKIELDISKVDFSNIEVHALTGLVKEFFRDLPEPLFPMAASDRVSYSQIGDENQRLMIVKNRIGSLPRNNLTVLKFLLEHLNRYSLFDTRVTAHSELNKMTIENLSLLFGALLFEKEVTTPVPTTSSSFGGWFGTIKGKKHQSDLSSFEHMKQELVCWFDKGSGRFAQEFSIFFRNSEISAFSSAGTDRTS